MKIILLIAVLSLTGCASYKTPGPEQINAQFNWDQRMRQEIEFQKTLPDGPYSQSYVNYSRIRSYTTTLPLRRY